MPEKKQKRCWVITELYAPDDAATAHLMTQIAEYLTVGMEVRAICAQPTYTNRGQRAPTKETLNGVVVTRCWSTTFSKDRLALRLVNVATIMVSFFFNMLFRFRRGDVVLVVTNPPPLPFAALLVAKIRFAKTCLLIHDIYPDVLVPIGMTAEKSFAYRIINFFTRGLYLRCSRIIAIGRDMKDRVVAKSERLESKTTVIANWADKNLSVVSKEQNPLLEELPFKGKFIIQYSGNMGRTHGLSVIADAASILEADGFTDVHWMICGWGAGKPKFKAKCEELELKSVSIHDPFPRDQLANLIGVADASIIAFIEGMSGISVPSRMYNILASGCPIIGVTESDSELAQTITDDDLGWLSPPEDPESLAKLVKQILSDPTQADDRRARCREIATKKFCRESMLEKYRELLDAI